LIPANSRRWFTLAIERRYNQIPDDSDAAIQTSGLLGAKYVGLGPGGATTYLANGSQIQFTQSALVLENLVNKLFAGIAGKKDSDAKTVTSVRRGLGATERSRRTSRRTPRRASRRCCC